jgi:hypothetical protein
MKTAGAQWLCLAILYAACAKEAGRQPVVLWSLENRVRPPLAEKEARTLAQGALRQAARAGRLFRFSEDSQAEAWRAEVQLDSFYQQQAEDESSARRRLELELVLWKKQSDGEQVRLSAAGAAQEEKVQESEEKAFRALFAQALKNALELIEIQLKAQKLSEPELARLLEAEDQNLRLQALKALRSRRPDGLLPRVVRLLKDPSSEVALEAVGVLVAWRAQSAVIDLIRSATGKNLAYQIQLLSALGEIGGPVARGYLFTVAAGHTSEQMRRLAEENFQKVLRAEGREERRGGEALHE